jgi:hypothetical protein
LEKNLDKIDWYLLSNNPNAIHLLEQNVDKISWHVLSQNPNAIRLLEQNIENIDWYHLSSNPNAIRLLECQLEYQSDITYQSDIIINWWELSKNPNAIHLLAPLNHEQMRVENKEFFQELVQFVCHPTWQMKCASRLHMDLDEYQYLLMECNVF